MKSKSEISQELRAELSFIFCLRRLWDGCPILVDLEEEIRDTNQNNSSTSDIILSFFNESKSTLVPIIDRWCKNYNI